MKLLILRSVIHITDMAQTLSGHALPTWMDIWPFMAVNKVMAATLPNQFDAYILLAANASCQSNDIAIGSSTKVHS